MMHLFPILLFLWAGKTAVPIILYAMYCIGTNVGPCQKGYDMNKEVPRRCKHGGCRNLTTNISGYCDQHSDDISKYRQSSSKRGYGYKWRKARERHLQLYPFCEECKRQGKPAVLATDVDHIVPHKGEPSNSKH